MKVLVISPSCAYVDRMSLNHRDIMDFIRRDDNFRVIEVEEVRDVNVDAYDVIINDTWPEFNKDFFASRSHLMCSSTVLCMSHCIHSEFA